MAADDDDIGAARNTRDRGDARHDRVIGFAAQQSGHDHRSAAHVDGPDIEPFGGENAEIRAVLTGSDVFHDGDG